MTAGTIESISQKGEVIPPKKAFSKKAHIKDLGEYETIYKRSVEDPEGFWTDIANELYWYKKWDEFHHWILTRLRLDGLKAD